MKCQAACIAEAVTLQNYDTSMQVRAKLSPRFQIYVVQDILLGLSAFR